MCFNVQHGDGRYVTATPGVVRPGGGTTIRRPSTTSEEAVYQRRNDVRYTGERRTSTAAPRSAQDRQEA